MATTITSTNTVTTEVVDMCDDNYYYVDATLGDDGGDGHYYEPWQTIGKVNGESFDPGDHILFKRGETFAGNLSPILSGDSSHPITYGAYGVGVRPVIDGSAARAFTISASAARYLRIEDIDFSGSTAASLEVVLCNTDNIYWYNCTFRDGIGISGTQGVGFVAFSTTGGGELHHITLELCDAHHNHSSGITISSTTGSAGPHDCLIKYCTAYNNGTDLYADHGIYVRHGCIVEHCLTYNNVVGSGIKLNCESVFDSAFTPIVRYCISYGNHEGITAGNVKALIYNNLFYGNINACIEVTVGSSDSLVYYNTFINSVGPAIALFQINGSLPTGMKIKNNLFIQDYAVHDWYLMRALTVTLANFAANNDIDYNFYYHGEADVFYDGTVRSWATWQGYGADAHGALLSLPPDFVTRYSDMQPFAGGNLVGLGVAIGGYGDDINGVARTNPPTPGCYDEPQPEKVYYLSSEIGGYGLDILEVTFTTVILASNYATGVTIKKGGVTQTIVSASRKADTKMVRYTLDSPAAEGDTVTWEYNSGVGDYSNSANTYNLTTYTAQSVTNNIMEFIVEIDLETGDISQFDSVTGADISVAAGAALNGTNFGLQIILNDADPDFGSKSISPPLSGILRGRYYTDPNSFAITTNWTGYVPLTIVASLTPYRIFLSEVLRSGATYYAQLTVYKDDGSNVAIANKVITDASQRIEVQVTRASSNVAADGTAELWIGGVSQGTLSGIDNYDIWGSITNIDFGARGQDAGCSGIVYCDELKINNTGAVIGA